jgi:hypothetical protein
MLRWLEGDVMDRLVPFYRLNFHSIFPMAPRNRYALRFKRFLKLVEHRQIAQARSILTSAIDEWLGALDLSDYGHSAFGTFWLFDPKRQAMPITRARCFPSGQRSAKNADWKSAAQDALRNPARKLGPPPPNLTRPGRCNFMHKPVFYGSFQEWTCMAELRPMVGSCVVLAQFKVTRPLKVFRLGAHIERLIMVPQDKAQADDLRNLAIDSAAYERGSFQYHLDLWMGMPLLVPYAHHEYVARRMVTQTLHEKLQCDGIEFTSSQVAGSNLVLFPCKENEPEFALQYIHGSAERLWVVDRPVYAEAF